MGCPHPPTARHNRRLRRLSETTADMNVITLTGRLNNDPVRCNTPHHGVVAEFRLAVREPRHRLWIDVESWGQLAGTVAAHLAKGRHVAVTGEIRHTSYHGRDGQRHDDWKVHADRIIFLDPPPPDPAAEPGADPLRVPRTEPANDASPADRTHTGEPSR